MLVQARAITHLTLSLHWSTPLPVHRQWSEAAASEVQQWKGSGTWSWRLGIALPVTLPQPCICSASHSWWRGCWKAKLKLRQFIPATAESSPWPWPGDPAPAALQGLQHHRAGTSKAAAPRASKGKRKEQSKPPVSRDKTLLQAKGLIEQQPEELQRNLKLNKQSTYC